MCYIQRHSVQYWRQRKRIQPWEALLCWRWVTLRTTSISSSSCRASSNTEIEVRGRRKFTRNLSVNVDALIWKSRNVKEWHWDNSVSSQTPFWCPSESSCCTGSTSWERSEPTSRLMWVPRGNKLDVATISHLATLLFKTHFFFMFLLGNYLKMLFLNKASIRKWQVVTVYIELKSLV